MNGEREVSEYFNKEGWSICEGDRLYDEVNNKKYLVRYDAGEDDFYAHLYSGKVVSMFGVKLVLLDTEQLTQIWED